MVSKKTTLFVWGWDRKIRHRITVCQYSVSLVMPNGDPQGGLIYPNLIPMIDTYCIKAVYSVTMNIFRKKNIFFLNHLQK